MQLVQLVHRHDPQQPLHFLSQAEVAREIQKEAPETEPGGVVDRDLGDTSVRTKEGQQRLETQEHSTRPSPRDADDVVDVVYLYRVSVVVVVDDLIAVEDDVSGVEKYDVGGRGLSCAVAH